MTVTNSDGSGWKLINLTNPSGVTSVTHTGCEDYDWIIAEFSEVETSASAFVYVELGYGSTPTYTTSYYNRTINAKIQTFGTTIWYPDTSLRTSWRRASFSIPNMSRNFSNGSLFQTSPVISGNFNASPTSPSQIIGTPLPYQEPLTAVRFTASAGNLQGTAAVIRTWGWRG